MLLNSSTVEGTKAQPVRVPRRKTPVESQIGRNILASPNLNNEVSNDVYDTESADYGFALHNISEGEEDARSDSFPINAMKNLNLNKSPGQLNNQEDDNYVEVELSSRPKELTTAKLRKTAIKRHPSTLQMMTDAIKDIDDKKGTSIMAIKKWILGTYPEVSEGTLKTHMKMAIVKGIEDGQFIRPKSTSIANQMSLTGRLRLKKATTSKLLPKPPKATKKLAGKDSHLHSPSSSDNEISSSDSRPAKGPAQVKKPTKSKKLPDGEDHNNDDVNEENKKKSAKSKKRANGKDNNNNDDDDNDKNGMDEKKKPRKGVTKPTTSKVSEGAKDSSKSKKATSSGKSTKKAQN